MLSSASGTMSSNGSYSNDRGGGLETEYAIDPASGGIFHSDFKKHDDLKEMLDSNKDNLKLEAMKRIIGMIAKGRDASMLFPAVVKNVVSKNIEVKKLVYVYLERYAEEQQDLALLSISTFQRALKEPNQLIRAGALRVLSSIRVSMIAPIVMLAIRDASADMSPYVRKTAAHAIPKLHSLDSEQKPELILIIQKLLADRTVLVIGSAVMAFTKVCPERVDLIHHVFRKLCTLLVDVDEWGQIIIVNMLTRYARTQFADPNLNCQEEDLNRPFYDSNSDVSDKAAPALDPDHRLLLRSVRPLLQSRNAAVVMAVAQLYHHCAPRSESVVAAKALVRLLRSHTEVQSIVLNAIASISYQRRILFDPFLKSFFVRTSDPTRVKLLKLDILTNLATDSNISVILRELQTYISSSDKQFIAATIQAIGRCACSISEVTDSCLNGLVSLLSNRDEAVVAESVVVIKRLLQTRAAEPTDIIKHMARLLDSITVPQARAAILWLLGEHCESVPKIAPDVLRKIAKTFADEQDIVKLQALNLALKLYITNPEQTTVLCQYIFNLARYDANYDIRDRVRLLKQFTHGINNRIISQATKIFLAPKPAPLLQSQFKDREQLQLGSLSHYINARANGYEPLPPFPEIAPPGNVRNVEPIEDLEENKASDKSRDNELYVSASSSSERDTSSSDESGSSSEEETSESESEEKKSKSSEEESEASSSEESESLTTSESEESIRKEPVKPLEDKPKSNLDLLLDLDVIDTVVPVMTPSLGGFLTPTSDQDGLAKSAVEVVAPVFIPTEQIELLNRMNGRGMCITFRFTRSPHIFSPNMVNINLTFLNSLNEEITNIKIGKKNLAPGMAIYDFTYIPKLGPHSSLPTTLGIDFNDSLQPAVIEIVSSLGSNMISIKPTPGEILRPVKMPESEFEQQQSKLCGMYEHSDTLQSVGFNGIATKILEIANVSPCPAGSNMLRFAGQTLTSTSLVLITLVSTGEIVNVTVNCEKIVIGQMLLNEIKRSVQ